MASVDASIVGEVVILDHMVYKEGTVILKEVNVFPVKVNLNKDVPVTNIVVVEDRTVSIDGSVIVEGIMGIVISFLN